MRISDWSSDVCSSDLQARGGFAHLADRAGCRGQRFGPQGLDRVGDDQFGLQRDGVFEDALDAGFGQRVDAVDRQAKPRGAAGHLRQGFLAGDIESRRSEEHTSELQSLMRISYAVFCLQKITLQTHTKYNP